MTCVAAVFRSPDDYALAADSAISGYEAGALLMPGAKIVRHGPWLIGLAGAGPVTQLWRRMLIEPWGGTRPAVEEALRALHVAALALGGRAGSGEYDRTGGALLAVGPLGIVEMDGFQCIYWHDGYRTIGTGESVALGALAAVVQERPLWTALAQVEYAVHMACRYVASCRGPVVGIAGPTSEAP